MTGKSHLAIGVSTGIATAVLLPTDFTLLGVHILPMLSVPAFGLGSLLSDVDIESSPMGKRAPMLAKELSHRGPTHCFLALGIFGVIAYILASTSSNIVTACVSTLIVVIYTVGAYKELMKLMHMKSLKWYKRFLATIALTLLLVGLEWVFPGKIIVAVILAIFFGLTGGYLTHLVSDSFNTTGVPLYLPVTLRKVRLMGIRTGKNDEALFLLAYCTLLFWHVIDSLGGILYV